MTDAVPFGVYIAPASIIRADIRTRVSDGEWCYIQLLKRMSDQSYSVHTASSCADLHRIYRDPEDDTADENVFVSTITRRDLHQQCRLLSAPGYSEPLYIAPDCVLKGKLSQDGEDLQLFASSAWLCYFRVLHVFDDGSVRVRVAALPHRVDGTVGRSYLTTLSRDEFVMAFQPEGRDLDMATCDLIEKVEGHAKAVSGRSFIEHVHPPVLFEEEEQTQIDEDALPMAQQPKIWELEPVFVPNTIYEQAIKRFNKVNEKAEHIALSPKMKQKIWLQAVLLSLNSYKEQANLTIQQAIEKLDGLVRDVLVNHLSGSLELVHSEPVHCSRRTQGYLVRIEQPIAA